MESCSDDEHVKVVRRAIYPWYLTYRFVEYIIPLFAYFQELSLPHTFGLLTYFQDVSLLFKLWKFLTPTTSGASDSYNLNCDLQPCIILSKGQNAREKRQILYRIERVRCLQGSNSGIVVQLIRVFRPTFYSLLVSLLQLSYLAVFISRCRNRCRDVQGRRLLHRTPQISE